MENSEPTRTCGQCNKDVAEANFALHETHCSRFLCLCSQCGEAVPRDQLRTHQEEQHSLVRCSKCYQKMERSLLEDHELEECVERLQTCNFCELQLPFKDLDEHCQFCGSRTERCLDCGRYVKLSDQSEHHLTCSDSDANDSSPAVASSTKKQTAHCSFCTKPFPVEEINKHELDCMSAKEDDDWQATGGATAAIGPIYETLSLFDRAYRDIQVEDEVEDDVDQISNCPHCDLMLPIFTLRWHQAKCQTHRLLKR